MTTNTEDADSDMESAEDPDADSDLESAEDERWADHATTLLEQALDRIDSDDVISTVLEALAALYLMAGETPHTIVIDVADYQDFIDEDEDECTCPPDLVARGGWQSTCEYHNPPARTATIMRGTG